MKLTAILAVMIAVSVDALPNPQSDVGVFDQGMSNSADPFSQGAPEADSYEDGAASSDIPDYAEYPDESEQSQLMKRGLFNSKSRAPVEEDEFPVEPKKRGGFRLLPKGAYKEWTGRGVSKTREEKRQQAGQEFKPNFMHRLRGQGPQQEQDETSESPMLDHAQPNPLGAGPHGYQGSEEEIQPADPFDDDSGDFEDASEESWHEPTPPNKRRILGTNKKVPAWMSPLPRGYYKNLAGKESRTLMDQQMKPEWYNRALFRKHPEDDGQDSLMEEPAGQRKFASFAGDGGLEQPGSTGFTMPSSQARGSEEPLKLSDIQGLKTRPGADSGISSEITDASDNPSDDEVSEFDDASDDLQEGDFGLGTQEGDPAESDHPEGNQAGGLDTQTPFPSFADRGSDVSPKNRFNDQNEATDIAGDGDSEQPDSIEQSDPSQERTPANKRRIPGTKSNVPDWMNPLPRGYLKNLAGKESRTLQEQGADEGTAMKPGLLNRLRFKKTKEKPIDLEDEFGSEWLNKRPPMDPDAGVRSFDKSRQGTGPFTKPYPLKRVGSFPRGPLDSDVVGEDPWKPLPDGIGKPKNSKPSGKKKLWPFGNDRQ